MKLQIFVLALIVASPASAASFRGGPAAVIYNDVSAAAGCKVVNIDVVDAADISTYSAKYDMACTAAQIAAGDAVIKAFDLPAWIAANPPRLSPRRSVGANP